MLVARWVHLAWVVEVAEVVEVGSRKAAPLAALAGCHMAAPLVGVEVGGDGTA